MTNEALHREVKELVGDLKTDMREIYTDVKGLQQKVTVMSTEQTGIIQTIEESQRALLGDGSPDSGLLNRMLTVEHEIIAIHSKLEDSRDRKKDMVVYICCACTVVATITPLIKLIVEACTK